MAGGVLLFAALLDALAPSAAAAARAGRVPPGLSGSEELPPSTSGLWLGIGLAVLLMGVVGALVGRRSRRRRATSAGPSDPLARDALAGCAQIFSALEPAYVGRSALAVEGPIRFGFVGVSPAGESGELRVAVRVQGRLKPQTDRTGISVGHRRALLALAATILAATSAAFVIAPAPRRAHAHRRPVATGRPVATFQAARKRAG